MPVHQGCVKGVIYPVVQSVAKQSAAAKKPAKKRVYKFRPKPGRICEACGGKVPLRHCHSPHRQRLGAREVVDIASCRCLVGMGG